jgi:hypothetical protein
MQPEMVPSCAAGAVFEYAAKHCQPRSVCVCVCVCACVCMCVSRHAPLAKPSRAVALRASSTGRESASWGRADLAYRARSQRGSPARRSGVPSWCWRPGNSAAAVRELAQDAHARLMCTQRSLSGSSRAEEGSLRTPHAHAPIRDTSSPLSAGAGGRVCGGRRAGG